MPFVVQYSSMALWPGSLREPEVVEEEPHLHPALGRVGERREEVARRVVEVGDVELDVHPGLRGLDRLRHGGHRVDVVGEQLDGRYAWPAAGRPARG